MSIQSEITRLSDARAALDAAIAAKGVQVPGSARLGDLPALIAAILTQKPEQSKTASPALTQQVITPDDGKALSSVTVEAVTKELLAALDESFKAENIKNGASILGLPGTFSPFGANAGISNYLIETFDFKHVGTSGGNAIIIRREGLGWIPHAAIHVLVGDSETGSPIAPNNHAVFAGFVDLRHWCPTYTKVLFYNFSLYNNGSDHAWWLPSVDMLDPANSYYTDRWTENNCCMARFKPERHLVIPGCTGDSLKVMDWIAQNTPQGTPVSIMRQYTPIAQCHVKGLNRRVTDEEYERVLDRARDLGLNAFVQEKESAQSKYIPDFNIK